MEKTFSSSYPMYDTVYGTEIPMEQYFVVKFDALPSKHLNNLSYDPSIIGHLTSLGYVEETKVFASNRRFDLSSQSLFVNEKKQIMIRVYGSVNKNKDNLVQIDVIYNFKNGDFDTQFENVDLKKYERPRKKCNISLVKSDMGHLDTEDYDLFVQPMDLEMNYGKSFKKVHEVIIERLNKPNDKGIILLHGDPGTGKTSYIKHLTTLVKDKDILFIPPSMAEMLSEPSIIPFLMDHKNSILIIEDAERVIADREGNGSPAGVSNILNLTDGILGDCLNIQILATFNMKREKIDQALLRKGRLIAEHKFEKLNVEDSNKLLKFLKKEHEVSEAMSLADIYNIDIELIKTSNKSKIGLY